MINDAFSHVLSFKSIINQLKLTHFVHFNSIYILHTIISYILIIYNIKDRMGIL